MLSKIITASLWGLEVDLITVETDLQNGMPTMNLVGLAGMTIKEAKKRIRPAIQNTGYPFPGKRLTINLSPAGRPKEGSHFDLPIAMGILRLGEEISDTAFIGELALDGSVKHVRGALPLAIGLRQRGITKLVLPKQNMDEVSILSDMDFFPVEHLNEAMEYRNCKPYKKVTKRHSAVNTADFVDIAGQESVKRAITVAAAGNHGILLVGSPGSGKTMMAKRIAGIMPEMSYEEQLETTKIHSIAGLLSEEYPLITQRPFRAPHHSISRTALVGGGRMPVPGEISLAHNGILFLDEFSEFDVKLLDNLRQPIEEEKIRINRAAGTVAFPCKTMLVAAANPCRCGYLGDEHHVCTCSASKINEYLARFSAPLMDRIDLHIRVSPVPYEEIKQKKKYISSYEMRIQIANAVYMQRRRYHGTKISFNSRIPTSQIDTYCPIMPDGIDLLKMAYEKYELNMRTYYKAIKTARTIADLQQSDIIKSDHIAEALQYRGLNQFYRRLLT